MRDFLIRLLASLLSLFAASAMVPAAAADDPHVLVLGRISDDPSADYEQLRPLLDYVVPRMADVGIREGRILMARNVQQMSSYVRRGRVDWVTANAATGMLLQARANARPLLLTQRNGVSRDRSVFFVRRDSGVTSLEDLRGRSVAFQDASSTSGYFVPSMQLLQHGMSLQILLSPMDRPAEGAVGYVFARSELNIATWVHKRLVDAGTMSHLDWNNPQRIPPSYRGDFKAIGESPEYPDALELVRGNLDTKARVRLREVLIAAGDDPDAREALLQFFGTTRFLPIDPAAAATLRNLRAGVLRVRAEVE